MSLRSSIQGIAGFKAPKAPLAATASKVQPPAEALHAPYIQPPHIIRYRILMPIQSINQGTLTGLRYAKSLSSDVTAIHVTMDRLETEKLQKEWPAWSEGVRLVVLDSPHNMVLEPLLQYIQSIMELMQPNEVITVVVPQSIHPRWWTNLMRTQMASLLRLSLPFETGIVITDVPYALEQEADNARAD